jgi:single-strand DNA-binding protein
MLNKIFLQGRLVADPELRHTPSGVAIASFRLAVDRDFKDRETGEKKADFINVVAWRQTGEFVSRFFNKGRMAIVEGRLQIRDYNDRDGNRRTIAEVVADNVYFGDSRKEGEGGGYAAPGSSFGGSPYSPAPGGAYSAPVDVDQFAELSDDDGELPF